MLVIGLGIAILVVLALMIGMAIRQAVYGKPEPAPAATASLKPGDVPELNLDLQPGMTVAETRMNGTYLIVRIVGTEAEEVLVIDPTKTRVISRIRFNKKVL